MRLEKGRHSTLLYHLLNQTYCSTSEILASLLGVSQRTVKQDISDLNRMLKLDGIVEIISLHSRGYYVEIIDANRYPEFYNECIREYNMYKFISKEKINRCLFISQKLLANPAVILQDIADELYLTKSALKEEMIWVGDYFQSYNVQIKSAAAKGLYIVGDEFDIRQLIVETFCYQYSEAQQVYEVNEFKVMVYENEQLYSDIRQSFLQVIRNSHYSTLDIMTKKLAVYLCVVSSRYDNGNIIQSKKILMDDIESTYEYALATQIFNACNINKVMKVSSDEIAQFALLLVGHRDINIQNKEELETYNCNYIEQVSTLYDYTIKNLTGAFSKVFFKVELMEMFRNDFISLLLPVYYRTIFGMSKQQKIINYYGVGVIECSVLSIEIARDFFASIQTSLKETISSENLAQFITLIDYLLKKVNYAYNKQRIAIITTSGHVIQNHMRTKILERFDKYIEYAHIFNQYEMRKVSFDDYDTIVTDSEITFNNYPVKFVRYNPLSLEDETLHVFDDLFKTGFKDDMIEHIIKLTYIINDFKCSDFNTFIKLISFKYCLDGNYERFETQLLERHELNSYLNPDSGVGVIFCDYNRTGREYIDIYDISSKMDSDINKDINVIFVVSLADNYRINDLKLINRILNNYWYSAKDCEDLMENKEEAYNNMFKKVVKNHFVGK